ncbi:MAG: peptide chain release factor 3 [Bdellovibrionaceae bacterium]|nr:peptide chain release factor 3 [Pseudobdellovibrionaceae bacterium]|tara:strand:- start:953 stop:2548 length:1596 start_codon:yes stop_codon:yes gene_type:complete
MSNLSFKEETLRRRTFAIISHPDAGKTTITEKILYQGGVVREAGEVHGKAGSKKATSDWMSLEQERGVSITSSVMQFDYHGLRVNLLDTPGHKDFGEDTYRTLVAADSAAMLIDAAKGVEAQTRKLYEVCRMKKLPIFTFANKMDREGKEPLEIIDDVENTLGVKCYPVTWPIGMGEEFKGLYHRTQKKLYLYTKGKEEPEVVDVTGYDDPKISQRVGVSYGVDLGEKLKEDLELLELAIGDFHHEEFMEGKVSPMTFGSAKNNWGVDLFLDLFCEQAPAPFPRHSDAGEIDPLQKDFSGFVFKIQANMDKKHRDRVAFLRICSGQFERGMKVHHPRLKRELRLSYANQFLARERETVEVAYPGDIVGLIDTGYFQIGDTITSGKNFQFDPIPRFSPEIFARLSIKDPLKRKSLQKGVGQLAEEGTIQLLIDPVVGPQDPVIGVVGELQLEVLLFRLNDEYKLDAKIERMPFSVARWPVNEAGEPVRSLKGGARIFEDAEERPVVLLEREWDLKWLEKENPGIKFLISGSG